MLLTSALKSNRILRCHRAGMANTTCPACSKKCVIANILDMLHHGMTWYLPTSIFPQCQDRIGWRNLMEGRVSIKAYKIQCSYLGCNQSKLTGNDWMIRLISWLIHISHAQWILWNFTPHDKQCGYKQLKAELKYLFILTNWGRQIQNVCLSTADFFWK